MSKAVRDVLHAWPGSMRSLATLTGWKPIRKGKDAPKWGREGVSPNYLTDARAGRIPVTDEMARRIATALRVHGRQAMKSAERELQLAERLERALTDLGQN